MRGSADEAQAALGVFWACQGSGYGNTIIGTM
jgi:hypothetical protein